VPHCLAEDDTNHAANDDNSLTKNIMDRLTSWWRSGASWIHATFVTKPCDFTRTTYNKAATIIRSTVTKATTSTMTMITQTIIIMTYIPSYIITYLDMFYLAPEMWVYWAACYALRRCSQLYRCLKGERRELYFWQRWAVAYSRWQHKRQQRAVEAYRAKADADTRNGKLNWQAAALMNNKPVDEEEESDGLIPAGYYFPEVGDTGWAVGWVG
jgi:hypothetical protein